MQLIQTILLKSWDLFVKNIMLLIGMFSLIFLITIIMSIFSPNDSDNTNIQYILYRLSANLFSMGLTLGSIRIILDVINGLETKIENLFNSFQMLAPYLGAYLLFLFFILFMFIPFAPLIISFENGLDLIKSFLLGNLNLSSINYKILFLYLMLVFYFWIKTQFFPYLIISKEMGAIESLKKSFEITEGYTTTLALFYLILLFINLIGAILFGLGLIFTIPFSLVAIGTMYTALDK